MSKVKKLYVLYNGMLRCDLANLIAMPRLGSIDEKERLSEWAYSPVTMFLIEHEDGLILFDTGCNPEAMNGRWNEGNVKRTPYSHEDRDLLVNQLESLGYRPDDIDYVVVSHLHEDHAGGLEFFKNSTIIVSDTELAQTMKLFMLNGDMGGYIRNDIRKWVDADLHWTTVKDHIEEDELLPGVKILNFGPGHTFGMLGLEVELEESGCFVLASDAINTTQNFGPPIKFPGLAYDTRGYEKTIERIARIKKDKNAMVLFGHDYEQLKTLKVWPDGYYA